MISSAQYTWKIGRFVQYPWRTTGYKEVVRDSILCRKKEKEEGRNFFSHRMKFSQIEKQNRRKKERNEEKRKKTMKEKNVCCSVLLY